MSNLARSTAPAKVYPILSVRRLASLLAVKPQTLRDLAKVAGTQYNPFDRKQVKSNGRVKWRHIDNPSKPLKFIQQKINKNLLNGVVQSLPEGMTGGISGRSILDNARRHLSQQSIAVLDLKDCFPKTSNKKIFKIWRNYLGAGEEVASLLTKLTTFQRRLPQGAPTSSSLCNVVLFPLYKKIEKYTTKNGLSLSLYVDDVTISGKNKTIKLAIPVVIGFIQKSGYAVRRNKIEIMTSNTPQKTTGLLVNRKISVLHKTREGLRRDIIVLSRQQKLSSHDFASIEGKINHIGRTSKEHADKLKDFANLLLLDKLDPNFYGEATSKKDETRVCKNTKRHKYGL
jgi:hypothetical protein